ncbi:MAG: c-type cytochrome [Gammaproteobacteria bacterium]|nr:c-type cytochrome [Gammaproteobacteria bacterium]
MWLCSTLIVAEARAVPPAANPAVQPAANPAVGDSDTATWQTYNGPYGGDRFSSLEQIDAGNAQKIQEVCRVRVGELGTFQTGLLVADGRMYLTTPTATIALDPATCEVLWKRIDTSGLRGETNRGPGYSEGRVFRGSPGANLSAYDAATGKDLWSTHAGDPALGEWIAAAPVAWNGLVFAGLAAGDLGIRGRIFAFDAVTGKKVWTFNLVPEKGEPGAGTWTGVSAEHGGGGTWTTVTIDPATGELFVPVGNPAPDFNPRGRQGSNLYTDSIVVLDANTGKMKWWYQLRAGDTHDWDLAAAPMLYTTAAGRRLVVAAAKDGYAYGVDRASHQLVFKTPLLPRYKNDTVVPTPAGVEVCPGPQSGVHWNGPAFDRLNRAVLVAAVVQCGKFASNERPYQRNQVYFGGSYELLGTPSGVFSSLDAETGKVRWQHTVGAPLIAAVTPTAGNVTFAGDLSGKFYVLRSSDGEMLKTLDTGGALAGGIITYSVGSKQYVAVNSGNVSRVSIGGSGLPTVIIYSLPGDEAVKTPVFVPAAAGTATIDAIIGEGLFAQVCAGCHGASGEGAAGPSLKGIGARATVAQTKDWIRNPKSSAMPKLFPESISDQDVDSLAAYIRTLKPESP